MSEIPEGASRTIRTTLPWEPELSYGGWGGHAYHETTSGCMETPVVFVHGNGRTANDWVRHASHLLENGYSGDALWAVTFPHDATPHEEMAAILNEFIENVLEVTGASEVDIVAHSLGVTGVRNWFYEYDGPERTERFIAIAGANGGLPLYLRSLPVGGDRLQSILSFLNPYRGKLATLNERKAYSDVETYTLRGRYDGLFLGRRDSPALEAAEVNEVFPYGHDSVRSRTPAIQQIRTWLTEE